MQENSRAKKVILRHRVCKVQNNRVCKEKGLIKYKASDHIEHEARETQDYVGHEARREQEHGGHEACEAREHIWHEEREAREYVGHESMYLFHSPKGL